MARAQRRASDLAVSAAGAVRRTVAPAIDTVTARRLKQLTRRRNAEHAQVRPYVDDAIFQAASGVVAALRRGEVSEAVAQRWQDLLVDGFRALYERDLDTLPPAPVKRAIVDQFHRLYYHDRGTWRETFWLGTRIWKCPLDLWLYQEILHEVRPALIVETGTAFGGSASYLAHLCDIVGKGAVVSIDVEDKPRRPQHERLTYIHGSSTDPEIVKQVTAMVPEAAGEAAEEPVVVILDSDHSEAHVYAELQAYADLVTPNSYVIVEDTNVNGHPAFPEHGPGPMEAVDRFLAERDDFVIDESKHKFHMTFNPRGVLKKLR